MKTLVIPILFIIGVFYSSHSFAQESIGKRDGLVITDQVFTAKEIDSLTPVMRQYFYDGNYEKVVEIAPTLIKQAKEANLYRQEYGIRSILGNTFIQLDDFDSTLSIFNEGLERAKKANDTVAMLSSYIDLGNTFIERNPKKAIEYLKNALALSQSSSANNRALFITRNNLAELYVGTEELKEAQYHLDKAHALLEKDVFKDWKNEYNAVLMHTQGAIYLKQKDYTLAITSIKNSLDLGIGEFDENYLVSNYENLMTAYENLGQYKNVNEIRHVYGQLMSKRNKVDKIKLQKIADSKFKLDNYKQELRASQLENEISRQKQAKSDLLLNISYIASAILLILLAFLFYARYKRKKLLEDLKRKNQQYLKAKDKSEKLAQSNTKFLSTISHELRTPLYGIIGLSSAILKDPKLKGHKDDLTSLKFSADYLLALVNDVLHINKFDSEEGQKSQKVHFELKKFIQHITQTFEFVNKKNNNKVTIDIDPEIPKVLVGDKTKISQVLLNLIGNACKFTEDGEITIQVLSISYEYNSLRLLFSVKDTGPGISPEDQLNIFNEFTQVGSQSIDNSRSQGTGLGLSIVKKILKVMKSEIFLQSKINEGSEFTFELPLEVGSKDAILDLVGIQNFTYLIGKKVLIVDDNKINQVVTQKILEQYGMLHKTVSDGKEAVAMAEEETFDIILMDINMPIMNGLEASMAIRTFNTTTPIIALTATNYKNSLEKLTDYGINDSIVKPYRTEDFAEMLLHLMA